MLKKDGLDTVCRKNEDTKKNTPRHWCPSNMNGKGKCIPRIRDGKNMYRSICIPDTEEVLNKQKYNKIKMIIKKKINSTYATHCTTPGRWSGGHVYG
jgi:hypothetical protein